MENSTPEVETIKARPVLEQVLEAYADGYRSAVKDIISILVLMVTVLLFARLLLGESE